MSETRLVCYHCRRERGQCLCMVRFFWYSETQKAWYEHDGDFASRFALIDGEEIEYTQCDESREGGPLWPDREFLGFGLVSRVVGLRLMRLEHRRDSGTISEPAG